MMCLCLQLYVALTLYNSNETYDEERALIPRDLLRN